MSAVTLKGLDESELARMVQAKFAGLCRVVLRLYGGYTSLGIAGSAKDLIRAGFCNSKMIAQLPKCGVKRYGDTTIKRLRAGFRVETTYYWNQDGVTREKVTAALGLPPGSLARAERPTPVWRHLPRITAELAKRYPGLKIEATQASCGVWHRQCLYFNGSQSDIAKSGFLAADTLARCTAATSGARRTYTEYGDGLLFSEYDGGTCRVGIYTDHDEADADADRRSNTKKLQVQVDRMLRPFARGTWTPRSSGVR